MLQCYFIHIEDMEKCIQAIQVYLEMHNARLDCSLDARKIAWQTTRT